MHVLLIRLRYSGSVIFTRSDLPTTRIYHKSNLLTRLIKNDLYQRDLIDTETAIEFSSRHTYDERNLCLLEPISVYENRHGQYSKFL